MPCPYCGRLDTARHHPLTGVYLAMHIAAKHPEQASTPIDTPPTPVREHLSTPVDTPERGLATATANPSPPPDPNMICPTCNGPTEEQDCLCSKCLDSLLASPPTVPGFKKSTAIQNPSPPPKKTPAPPKKTPIPPKKPRTAFRKTHPDLPSREGHCMGCAKTPAPYMVKEAPNEKLCETCKDRAVKILANPRLKHSKDGGVSIKLLRHLLRFSPKKK